MAAVSSRFVELDVLRGLAVAGMILVVSPGSWEFTYAPLQHADWHGWTFADLIFPDFLFGVGMAIGLTFGRSVDPRGDRWRFYGKVGRRVIGLILLGLALNYLAVIAGWLGAPSVGPEDHVTWRIPGVLQRIAVAYLLAVMIVTATSTGARDASTQLRPGAVAAAILAILVAYWAILTFVPVPGFGADRWDKAGNLPAYIDRAVFGTQHMWPLGSASWRGPVLYDPEGILASLPASANVLFGVLAISIWTRAGAWRVSILLAGGIAMVAAALLLDPVVPINKKLWTSSFVLLTCGLSFLALLIVAALIRTPMLPLLAPLRVLGGNAILAFSISIILSAIAGIPFTMAGQAMTAQQLGYDLVSTVVADPYVASLACAFGILAFILILLLPLHRRGMHLRL